MARPGLRRHASTTTPLVDLYPANAGRARARRRRPGRRRAGVVGSTDMGNVSHLVPSIHPMIQVSPPDVADPHARVRRATPAARAATGAVLDGAKAMAMTVADLWLRPDALDAGPRPTFDATPCRRAAEPAAVRARRHPGGPPWAPAAAATLADRDRLRRRGVHARRGRRPPALLHQPRRPGLRPGEPARGGEGRAVRPLLPVAQEPAAAVPRRVRRRARHHRRRHASTPPSACAGPRSSTTGCSSSTATTRWPSSAASTWPASRRRTCSPRCSSGAG